MRTNIFRTLSVVTSLMIMAGNVHAQSLEFRARVVSGSCQLDFSDFGNVLDLGSMNMSEVSSGKGYTTPQVPFSIILRQCPAEYPQVSLSFQGEVDENDDRLLAVNHQGPSPLQGAGIAFYDLNTPNSPAPLMAINTGRSVAIATDSEGNAQLRFAAAMMVDGKSPVPGLSQPVVSVTVNYY